MFIILAMNKKVYHIPFKGFYTYCYTFGDLSKGIPLIILHGGPGGCVERYEPLEELADKGIPLIFYDQLGCGYSKVPKGNKHLWVFETYLDELDNLIKYFKLKKFNILGHSWGGMLALEWVTTREHSGLNKLILFSTLPSTKIWNDEHFKMIEFYPEDEKAAILQDYNGEECDQKALKKGLRRFYLEHVSRKKDKKYVFKRKRFKRTNKEIYEKMWGKSELFGTGTLKDWNTIPNLKKIDVETLVISGRLDESTVAINELLSKEIPNAKSIILEKSHHVGYAEEPELTLKYIREFIK